MDKQNDGGPAFPQSVSADHMGTVTCSYDFENGSGMSLRDYFAAQALVLSSDASIMGLLAKQAKDDDLALVIAAGAYQIADAMLRTRAGASK